MTRRRARAKKPLTEFQKERRKANARRRYEAKRMLVEIARYESAKKQGLDVQPPPGTLIPLLEELERSQ
jgi:hypothetical protein